VNPYDPDAVAVAIARAVAMPLNERKARHAELYAALLRNDISKWGDKFLRALNPPNRQARADFAPVPPAAIGTPPGDPAVAPHGFFQFEGGQRQHDPTCDQCQSAQRRDEAEDPDSAQRQP